ncbi:radial spokehead-like protein [Zopfochytrium polystomum]|nr:radial spokehead-like protein [Zopfochytrium polystomum]
MLETRPANAVDIFEAISADVKKSKFDVEKLAVPGGYKPVPEDIPGLDEAKSQSRLLEPPIPEEERPEDLGETPDIMDLANLWEWAGVSFGKEETFIIFLSLQRLVQEKPLKSVRLWGKILGLHRSYIVTEAELKDGMQDEDPAAGEPAESPENEGEGEGAAVAAEGEDAAGNASGGAAENETGLPKPKVKVIPPLSKEVRTGVNKYVYYVCNFPGGKWWRLPDVIPEKLQVARKIRKHFTGDLNKQIVSYPAFDGTEAQYLRCQIARISAATVASPAGYYTFDPQEGDGEDEEHQQTIIINPEFEGVGNATLLSPSNWVHHVPYILPQGRVTWENPLANLPKKGGEDGDGDDGDGDGSDGDGEGDGDGDEAENVEPETGPPILSPLVADEDTPDGPAWVARSCTVLSPAKFAPVMLRSTRWPGAVIVAYNDKFANVYIGDGHREVPSTSAGGLHLPPPLPPVQKEYDADGGGGEMRPGVFTEQRDPTVEEETAFEEAQKAKEEQDAEEGEEGAGSEGGGEEDEEE